MLKNFSRNGRISGFTSLPSSRHSFLKKEIPILALLEPISKKPSKKCTYAIRSLNVLSGWHLIFIWSANQKASLYAGEHIAQVLRLIL